MLQGPGCSTVREDREDQGRPESTVTLPPPPRSTGAADSAHLCRPPKLGPRCEVLMAASGQDSPPRDEGCAEILAAPGGSTRGRLRTSSGPRSRFPPGPGFDPRAALSVLSPLSLEPLQPPPCLLHSQPAVSALPRASALGQSPRWPLLLRACPSRAPEPPRQGGQGTLEAVDRQPAFPARPCRVGGPYLLRRVPARLHPAGTRSASPL